MKESKTFYDKAQSMDNAINNSGNDDFNEVQSVFEHIRKRELYLLKEKRLPNDKNDMHGGVSSAAADLLLGPTTSYVDDEKKDDEKKKKKKKKKNKKKKKKKKK
eukprot:97234_1